MPAPAIIVIGASAGGVEALRTVVAGLDADIPAAVFVVLHIPARGPSALPAILARAGPLPAQHAEDGLPIEAGRIFIAPPDFHLLVERHAMFLRRGPQENGTRPAVDPLFRSAAAAFGRRTIGVVLSGSLDDGTSGLLAIKRHHGVAIVQHPDDALHRGMPSSALASVRCDHVLGAAGIGPLLNRLAREERQEDALPVPPDYLLSTEAKVDMQDPDGAEGEGEVAGLSCPHCNGSLWQVEEEGHLRFRCRVGHRYGPESLLDAQADSVEAALWTAVRALEETSETARRIAARISAAGVEGRGARQLRRAHQAERHAAVIRGLLHADDPGSGLAAG
jgi:two-component system, chemotaxis family, protein-glutamate methylesterase/glutaminase